MPVTNWRGISVPTENDPIVGSLQAMADTTSVITRTQSVATARALLDNAQAAGLAPTRSKPAYFDIYENLYACYGDKLDGQWALYAMNECEAGDTTYKSSWGPRTLNANQYTGIMSINVPAQPYDRRCMINAGVYIYVTTGIIDALLSVNDARRRKARASETEVQTVTLYDMVYIPAGQQTKVELGIIGGSGRSGTAALSADPHHNYISYTTFPCSITD